jgi:type I restriction enzyme M protein
MVRAAPHRPHSDRANRRLDAQLWLTADKLHGNMEPSNDKHISDSVEAKRAELLGEYPDVAADEPLIELPSPTTQRQRSR